MSILRNILLSALLCGALFVLEAAPPVPLTVIQTTDIHANADGFRTPGAARLASVIESERAAAGGPDKTLLIDCGDLFQGSWEATLDHGRSFVRYLNLLSYDVFVPGNHDFDFGTAELIRRINGIHAAVLGFNMELRGLPPGKLLKWKLFEKNSLLIAVAGMTSPYLFTWLSDSQTDGLRLLDHEAELSRIIPEIMEAKPDIIILAMHNGEYMPARLDTSSSGKRISFASLLRKYPQIDLVLGAHTHQEVQGKALGGSWYMQAPALSAGAAVAEILYDKEQHRIVSLRSRIAYAADAVPGKRVQKMLEPLLKQGRREGSKRIARMAFALEPLKKGETENRLSRVIGKAMLAASGAKIALSGTLSAYRTGPGVLHARQIYLLAPYENLLCTIEVTEAECRAIIEEQYAKKRSGIFQTVSGISYRTGRGGRVSGALRLSGEESDWRSGSVKLVLTGYLLAGAGGRFPVLREIGKRKKAEFLHQDIRSALEKYLAREYPCTQTENTRQDR